MMWTTLQPVIWYNSYLYVELKDVVTHSKLTTLHRSNSSRLIEVIGATSTYFFIVHIEAIQAAPIEAVRAA